MLTGGNQNWRDNASLRDKPSPRPVRVTVHRMVETPHAQRGRRGLRPQHARARAVRAFVKLMRLTSERLSTVQTWHRVAEGNCVAARRGGEQPEANLSSQNSLLRQLNPIRPFGMASLRRKGEAQVKDLPETITKHVSQVVRESEGVWGE